MPSEKNNFVKDDYLGYLYILDSNYNIKLIIDSFTDLLWTERYHGYGEFELTVPIRLDIIQDCRINDYVMIRESNKIMIVETIAVKLGAEQGDKLVISGRSLESILDRRVVLNYTVEKGKLQDAIKTLISDNIINPFNEKRKIEGFSFKESEDPRILELEVEESEVTGENLYNRICDICSDKDVGFRVNAVNNGEFEFELYFGVDRSWDQDTDPTVTFSDSYENLSNSSYLQTERNYKSMVYVYSTYESEQQKRNVLYEVFRKDERTGLLRREAYVKENDIDSKEKAVEKGKEYLSDYKVTKMFEGETEPSRQFVYGIDYYLGDIVQLENKYGQKGKCRVTEIVRSRDSSGPNLVPTFEAVEDDDE